MVKPFFRYDEKKGIFHFVSPSGHLIYKCKKEEDLIRFRNNYLNPFVVIMNSYNGSNKLFYKLYKKIRKEESWFSVKYRGCFKTWLRYRLGI